MKIEGAHVELTQDFSITMNLKSPIFNDVGSYSYPFRIPSTPRNKIKMGFRHRVEATGNVYHEYNGVFFWNGICFFTGTVKMKVLNSSNFEGYLMANEGDFNFQRKNKTLQDIDFGQMVFDSESIKMQYINDCVNTLHPDRPCSFPQIRNDSYFDTLPSDPALQYFNYYYYDPRHSLMQIWNITRQNNRGVIVPMLYLRYVLNKIFEHLSYVFDDSFFSSDSDYNSMVLYNSVDCNTTETGYFLYDTLHLFFNYHVPRMNMNDFLSGLESFFNIRFFVNNTTRTIRLISVDKIVRSAGYKEFSRRLISISTEPEDQITGFHPSMEMQTDDMSYFLSKVSQETVLKRLKGSVQSVSDLNPWPGSEIFDTRFVMDVGQYYILRNDKTWGPINSMYWTWNLFSEWIYKNDDQSIETNFSSLMSELQSPYNAVVGNKMTDWKEVSPKLFFVRYVDNGVTDRREVGRCYTESNGLVTNNLFYGLENGLLNKHYKSYFDFRISTKMVKIVKQMDFAELKDFDFSQKYMINGTKYLVKSIQVVLKKDRIMPATLECYTCSES